MPNLLRVLGFLLVLTALAWRTGQPSSDPVALCPNFDRIVTHHTDYWQTKRVTDTTYLTPPEGCE